MIGSNIIFLPEVDSTNNYVAKLVSEGNVRHGTVILAEKQTNGRGQRGNTWQSGAKNQFTASWYLETAFLSVQHAAYLNKALAVAVAKAISGLVDVPVAVKWPNDILVNDRKLGGMLIEGNVKQQRLESVVFGLGINLSHEEGLPKSISLEEFGVKLQAFELLTFLLPKLQELFEQCQRFAFVEIQQEYLGMLWRKDVEQEMQDAEGNPFSGKITGVDETGSVLITTAEGTLAYGLQEVKFLY